MELVFQFALGLVGAIFGAGVAWTTMRLRITKAQTDVNNIGAIGRKNEARQERRWLFQIADSVEEAETVEQRARLAARIRHEAYRE